MKTRLDYRIGHLFPPTPRFVGRIVFVVGILALYMTPLVGVFLILAGAYVGFGVSGVKLFPSESTYQDYTGLFGLRFGKKQSNKDFPFLSVMRTKVTSSAFSMSNRNAVTGTNIYYDVYLLSQTHREQILVSRHSNQYDAKQNAQELGVILSKDVVMYNPKMSVETRNKR